MRRLPAVFAVAVLTTTVLHAHVTVWPRESKAGVSGRSVGSSVGRWSVSRYSVGR